MLITIAVRILEAMFVLGIIGAAVVVVLTIIEDWHGGLPSGHLVRGLPAV